MALYQIHDSDRPAFVFAKSFDDAVNKWSVAVAKENDGEAPDGPQGVMHIADDSDLIIGDTWVA